MLLIEMLYKSKNKFCIKKRIEKFKLHKIDFQCLSDIHVSNKLII